MHYNFYTEEKKKKNLNIVFFFPPQVPEHTGLSSVDQDQMVQDDVIYATHLEVFRHISR